MGSCKLYQGQYLRGNYVCGISNLAFLLAQVPCHSVVLAVLSYWRRQPYLWRRRLAVCGGGPYLWRAAGNLVASCSVGAYGPTSWSVTGLRAATTPLPCIRSLRAYAASRTPGQGMCRCLGLPRQYLHFASPVRVQVQPRYSAPISAPGLRAFAWREDVNGGGDESVSPMVPLYCCSTLKVTSHLYWASNPFS